jgi:CO/xanthine dehydrogenase Mo-binding subunit
LGVGSIGEPGLPSVRPAMVGAVAALTWHRIRNPLMSKVRFGAV